VPHQVPRLDNFAKVATCAYPPHSEDHPQIQSDLDDTSHRQYLGLLKAEWIQKLAAPMKQDQDLSLGASLKTVQIHYRLLLHEGHWNEGFQQQLTRQIRSQ